MKTRMPLASIERDAALRPAGYLAAVLAAGRVDGAWVWFETEDLARLKERFGDAETPKQGCAGCGQ